MWRDTDSWFLLQFSDGSEGYAHLDSSGGYIGVYRANGTPVGEENVEYTCVNDNTAAPSWYTPPVVEPAPQE
jgi:hypothetical protein